VGAGIIIASGIYIVLREDSAGTSRNQPVLNTRLRPDTGTAPRPSTLQRLLGRHPHAALPSATPGE
jgi:hypothetical protein